MKHLPLVIGFFACLTLSTSVAQSSAKQLKQIGEQTLRGEINEIVQAKLTGGNEYIAALFSDPAEGNKLAVIRRVGNGYTVIFSESTCCMSNGDLKLTDLNKDGYPEVFYTGAGGGTGVTTYDFYLTNLRDRKTFHAYISIGNNSGRGTLNYDPALLEPSNAKFLNFMQPFIERSDGFAATKAPPTPEELWTQQYGRFTLGQWQKTQIKPKTYSLSGKECSTAREYLKSPDPKTTVKVGDTFYIAAFKGPVYAANKAKNHCYVVYMPETYYDWIFPLKKLSNGTLVFYDRTDANKVVYFNPNTNTLWR